MKDIKGYEGEYAITKDGKVWSYFSNRFLKSHTTKDGKWYYSIKLKHDGKGFKVHRLVAQAYIPNPKNLLEVNHKNGIKGDNRVENLEWCTRKENLNHGFKIYPISKRLIGKKLNPIKVRRIRKEYENEETTYKSLAKKYNVSQDVINGVINGYYWKHVT